MLLSVTTAQRVRDGSVTHVYRRWDVVRVAVGSEFRSPAGVIRVVSIDEIDPDTLTDDDVHGSDAASAAAARAGIARRPGRHTLRVGLHWVGADPRASLRADTAVDAALIAALERMDRSGAEGAWTVRTLRAIEAHPGRSSTLLAEDLGRERLALKRDIRRLKELGLTDSLEVGYRIAPRGAAYLRHPSTRGS